ncbi:MAG: hypothetical protein U0271_04790 [Polyangiaceae bacterium]
MGRSLLAGAGAGWLTATPLILLGAGCLYDFSEPTDTSRGGSASGATGGGGGTVATGGSAQTGGTGQGGSSDCAGCFDGDTCVELVAQSETQCGSNGQPCSSCIDSSECTLDHCSAGSCENDPTPDLPCENNLKVCDATGACVAVTGENCFDHVDNDDDTLVDCGDHPDCDTKVTCVPNPPGGWSDPILFYLGPGTVTCPAGFTNVLQGGADPDPTPPNCNACSCTPGDCQAYVYISKRPTNPSPPDLCDSPCKNTASFPHDLCLPENTIDSCSAGSAAFMGLSDSSFEPPTCTAAAGTFNGPTAAFTRHALGCARQSPSQDGCGAGQVCVPETTPAGFETGYCIFASGPMQCPTDYSKSFTIYAGLNDQRTCSCGCIASGCLGDIEVFENPNLGDCTTSPVASIPVPNPSCVDIGMHDPSKTKLRFVSTQGATCTGTQPTPGGSLVPTGSMTVCCQP